MIAIKMETFAYAVVISQLLISVLIIVRAQVIPQVKQYGVQKNLESCKKFAKDPYFETELVVGKPWRVYHTWNMKIETKCTDMVFKNATPAIIHRIWTDMYDYMEQQPYWDSAALLLTMIPNQHELLLFPAPGEAGGFHAVPNVIRAGDIVPIRNGVTLLKFQLKLIRSGKYLVMMDCHVGITSLCARTDHPPYRSEIAAAVAELNLGDGFSACIQDKNKDEQFLVK